MSLLNSVANREVIDFLRTLTIKSTYFAERSRTLQVNPKLEDRVPETAVPYIIHLAGEYILNDKEFPSSDTMTSGEPWFQGYRRSRDTVVRKFKNYWQLSADRKAIVRILPQDMSDIYNPQEQGLYEIQPLVVEGIINPVTHQKETYEFSGSQMIYGADDVVTQAKGKTRIDRIGGYLNSEVKNSELYTGQTFDEMMFITSLDTKQEIPFCLEAFYADAALAAGLRADSIHVKTLEAYRVPGRYFDILCERYPKQVDLIKAIVYRVPSEEIQRLFKLSSLVTEPELQARLQTRLNLGLVTVDYIRDLVRRYPKQAPFLKLMGADIAGSRSKNEMPLWEQRRTLIAKADNFQLLAYDYERLDSTERVNLREYVEQVLKVFKTRWAVDEYNFEENYCTVLWTVLWSILPLALIARRYANVKTPSVCLTHMWDYLNSKGLASYRGYLTDRETWFLYKNIQYIFQHQAQQKCLDILVDNILADYGLTLKSKTVVLDTTDSLKRDEKPAVAKDQCATCARRGVSCFRNDTEHLCPEWLGTKHLCKAEPIVLTEDFIGATKDHIIRALKKSYGYDDASAEFKYRRSFIWRDDDIEKIKEDLNRDQMVDLNAPTESLAETLAAEHASGQEPVVNDLILEEQTKQLQHMHGTYAPTKLLELHHKQYNVKFTELFNRFITETFLRFAPTVGGKKKVTCQYHFETTESASSFIFDYGEMLAAGYLGFVRENLVDALVDQIAKTDDGRPLYDDTGIVIDYDKDGKPITLKKLRSWVQKRFTDLLNNPNYKFAIPDKCKTTTTFKFGKPVLQEELYKAWVEQSRLMPTDEQIDRAAQVTNGDDEMQILTIRDIVYAVTLAEEPNETEEDIWEEFPIRLKILGEFTHMRRGEGVEWEYHENNDEIPLIPKFFKWYYTHLNPSMDATEEEKEKMAVNVRLAMKPVLAGDKIIGYEPVEVHMKEEKDTDEGFTTDPKTGEPAPQMGKLYFDESRKQNYRIFQMSQFLNLDDLLDRWVDVIGTISDQNTIASYIDNMFEILEDIYTFASATGSIRSHVACSTFLDCVITQKEIRFDLTGTEKKHDNTEGGLSAWYEDWLNMNEELMGSISIIDRLKDTTSGWNEFNTEIVRQLLSGCSIQYAQETVTQSQYKKLKELVLSLSSYRITIIDNAETGRVCNNTVALVEDALIEGILDLEVIYFDPIGDSIDHPRVGGYTENEDENGFILVPTSDLRLQAGKTYFTLAVKDSDAYGHEDEKQVYHLKDRPLAHVELDLPEGTELPVSCEMINIPTYKVFQPYELSTDKFILKDKTYYKLNTISDLFVKTTTEDYVSKKVADITEEIPENALRDKDKEGNDIVYLTTNIYEPIEVGGKLPVGRCFEKINLYDILGLELGTPLLVGKKNGKWYFSVGTPVSKEICTPCSAADMDDPRFDREGWYASGDAFDLKNDFSNQTTKMYFDSVVYRLNINVDSVEWGDPVECPILSQVLYPTINREFTLRESIEPTAELVEESITEE